MIGNKRVLAITLARGGSKRVPKKNVAIIRGRPLIEYTFREVKESQYIDHYVVSTDDEDTIEVCKNNSVDYKLRRPELSTDTTTSASALIDCAQDYEEYDYIVEIMCTNPLKTVEDIDGVIKKLHDTQADSVVSVARIWDHHPSRVKYIQDDRLVDFYPEVAESRRQDLTPAAYVRNGSIYATTVASLFKNEVRLGPDTRPFIVPANRTINIDEPIDLELARILINKMKILCITPIKHLDGVYKHLQTFGEVTYMPSIDKQGLSSLDKTMYDVVFCNPNKQTYKLDSESLEGFNGTIITASTGLNHIDLKYCDKKNIKVLSLKNDYDLIDGLPSTAELAFGLMMSLLRKIPQGQNHVSTYNWDYLSFVGRQVSGLNIGIVGFGRLGKMMYKFCRAFGAKVSICDPYSTLDDAMAVTDDAFISLEEAVERCDVLSLHVHVTEETKGMINHKILSKAKNGLYIINTSRGEIVEENDIIEALKQNQIAGYATDVVVDEFGNLEDSPIIEAMNDGHNIIVTPHVGGMTWEGQKKAYNWAIDKMKTFPPRRGTIHVERSVGP